MRKLLLGTSLLALICAGPALAGDPMADVANCHVCKLMMPHMAELMPVMKMDVVTMNNGMAAVTTISDTEKVGTYHKTCDAMAVAGMETMEFSKEQAGDKLCSYCEKMWNIQQAGGHLSVGKTDDGQIMVLTSDDPEVQKEIAVLQKMYEQIFGS